MELYLVGGFLGSGKTTAIQSACTILKNEGRKAAVITNDQGEKLVDTAFLQSNNVPVEQIINGCFCCNYMDLSATIEAIDAKEQPDVIFAESVGSCTDLIATVASPLALHHPEIKVVISIFADSSLLHSLLTGNASFLNDDVRYIYKKQLEEADVLIVNKTDLLTTEELQSVEKAIASEYPGKTLVFQNSHNEDDIRKWLLTIDAFQTKTKRVPLEIDYDTYASGEALMAWLDSEIDIVSTDKNAYRAAEKLATQLFYRIHEEGLFVGHLKFMFDDGINKQKLSFTSSDKPKEQNRIELHETNQLTLLINARVQTAPQVLEEILSSAINKMSEDENFSIEVKKLSAFQPGYPNPVFRIAE